ncbi:MAG: DUF1330 domain-containing protein [Pseudomonadota bacterium]
MSDQNEVFAIAQLEVTDLETFMRDYAGPLQPIRAKHGVVVVAASSETKVLEGEYGHNLTVILKFPSAQAQEAWYADPDYQPLIKRRQELTLAANSRLVVLPAVPGAAA